MVNWWWRKWPKWHFLVIGTRNIIFKVRARKLDFARQCFNLSVVASGMAWKKIRVKISKIQGAPGDLLNPCFSTFYHHPPTLQVKLNVLRVQLS